MLLRRSRSLVVRAAVRRPLVRSSDEVEIVRVADLGGGLVRVRLVDVINMCN